MMTISVMRMAGTSLLGMLLITLAGCSSPRADFETACIENSGDTEGCTCAAERLDNNLDRNQYAQLVELMQDGGATMREVEQAVDAEVMEELMIAGKQCNTGM